MLEDKFTFDYEASLTTHLAQGHVFTILFLSPLFLSVILGLSLNFIGTFTILGWSPAWLMLPIGYLLIAVDYYSKKARFPCARCYELAASYSMYTIGHVTNTHHFISKELAEIG